jgi:hypothetical protein
VGHTACAPTGFLLPSGEPEKGCSLIYAEPASLAPQRLSVEQLRAATLPSTVLEASTTSIFQALAHHLDVEAGAVCVTGTVSGESGGLLNLDFQVRPNNGLPLDASEFSAFTFEAEGPHVVRFEADAHGASYMYLTARDELGDVGEGPQRIGFDELFDVFSGDAPFSSLDAAQLEAVRFSLILDEGPGPFRFCVGHFALQGPVAPPADAGP